MRPHSAKIYFLPGFYYAGAMASYLNCGFLSIRKANKLPCETVAAEYVNYTMRVQTMECRKNFDFSGMNVLLVDQWIETGGTVDAGVRLLEEMGCHVVGVAVVGMESWAVKRKRAGGGAASVGSGGRVRDDVSGGKNPVPGEKGGGAAADERTEEERLLAGSNSNMEWLSKYPVVQCIPACLRPYINSRDLLGLKRALS